MNLTRTNFPLGWRPDFDAVNGDPTGLLRMDNLRIDKNGSVGICDGMQTASATSLDFVSALFSKLINNTEIVWTAFGNPVTQITRATGGFFGITSLLVPGAGTPFEAAFFGEAFGYTLVVSGRLRVKDPILSAPVPLGLLTPGPPTTSLNNRNTITINGPTTVNEGSGSITGLTTAAVGTIYEGMLTTASALDLDSTAIGGAPAPDIGLDSIEFPFKVINPTPENLFSVTLDFILDGTPNDPATYKNYYNLIWLRDELQTGRGRATLQKFRWEAKRYGTDQTLDWHHVKGVRFTIGGAEPVTVAFGDITIAGGSDSGLNGTYEYIQVDVFDDGHYVAKSPASAPTQPILLTQGSVHLIANVRDTHVTEHRFYRRAIPSADNNSVLNQFYFVGSTPFGGSFTDTFSDEYILQLNSDGSLLPNLNLQTLRTEDTVNGLTQAIYGIEGIFNERILYMGLNSVYLSDRLNPDAIDVRFTLRPSGDPGEKNQWIKKLTNNVIILGTTRNLYEISGSMVELPDGSIDCRMIPIGEAYPPLSTQVCAHDGGLYYIAADGLRVTTGSNTVNVSPQLRHLFNNTILVEQNGLTSRHGFPGVAIFNGTGVDYPITAAHNRIYFVVPTLDGERRTIVYDTVTKSFEVRMTDPVRLYTTGAGEVLAAYGNPSNRVMVMDAVPGIGIDNRPELPFRLRTVFDCNNQPRNRKDTFTLKLVFDSGGEPISVDIQKDGIGVAVADEGAWTNLGQYSANGMTTIHIPLDDATGMSLGFRYAIQISDVHGVRQFQLYEFTIEYEPRPEQLDYLRILPTNLGTISRKRWTAFAFVIDTLGNDITFTPFLDNVVWGVSDVVSTGTKLTYIFYFKSEAIATDVGGTLRGGLFEFYGIDLNECISEKLPPPVKYLVLPADNYGVPNRKRHTSYKFQMLTRGADVRYTPKLDGVEYEPAIFNTSIKTTCEYFFPAGDVIGIDIGGTLESLANTPFEFYGNIKPQTIEVLPDRLKYLRVPNSNFGLAARKRIRTISLIIDTYGLPVSYTPIVDGQIGGNAVTYVTNGKLTVWYYFQSDMVGVDFGGIVASLADSPFEFYALGTPENIEPLPLPVTYHVIAPNNYGVPNRKRHTSYKFEIITRRNTVKFTPILDGIEYPPMFYQTSANFTEATAAKQTVEYFFPMGDVIGIDIGGILESVADPPVPFEFYGTVVPQTIEKLPDRLTYLRIPTTNFGVPSRKRVRTLPFVIDTYATDVTFYPIVDNRIIYPASVHNTLNKQTVYHFFVEDVFGTDFGGLLSCAETGVWLRREDQHGNVFLPE